MPAYNFRSQFADDVESGRKRQTIRPRRKRPTRPGDTLYHYTGMRTKMCRKLGEFLCTKVTPVDILQGAIRLGGRCLGTALALEFARADGFEGLEDFYRFFGEHYGLPVIGRLEVIEW